MALIGNEIMYVVPIRWDGTLSPVSEQTTAQAIANLGNEAVAAVLAIANEAQATADSASALAATKITSAGGNASAAKFTVPAAPASITFAQEAASWPDIRLWGVVADGVTDDTAAINAAFASGYPLRMPNTAMRVTDALHVTTQAFKCWFPNRTSGGLLVSSDFNMAALGVVVLNVPSAPVAIGLQQGPVLENLRIKFAQPDSYLKSAMTRYPDAVHATSTARIRLIDPRIVAGWNGLVFDGDCGGAIVENLESMCFNWNVAIDGALDTMRFINPHIWPFETTVNQIGAFFDPTTTGYYVGRCDGLTVFAGLTICPIALDHHPGSKLGTPLQGNIIGNFVGHAFDTFGGIKSTGGGWVTFTGGYVSLGPFTTPDGTATPQFAVQKTGSADLLFGTVKWLQAGMCSSGSVVNDLTVDASFTGSISGTTLAVTAVSAGIIEPGFYVTGSGVTTGTAIAQQLTGTPGGVGTYQVTTPQTVASEALVAPVAYGCISIDGGEISQGGIDQTFAFCNGAKGKIIAEGFYFYKGANQAYADAMFLYQAGGGTVRGTFSRAGTGTGDAVVAGASGVRVLAEGNNLDGWAVVDSSGGTSSMTGNFA